ncbi:MAG: hypothetical protein D8M57_14375 [Candidatus Scalindua sp. AMX11]|nr:MAG: hypothetical protein DWQ00_09630 [Candidatus Scalindua sp.]NOG82380.1 hypothetical protein [Planctomycetota bacterium]RZV70581.1 MAG: hypothetical protein EX341_15370 [Candidatus Scalindua sp. SCAELEC01]TDE64188.1 MAG: hypothetical protein D8M57_14375 [Candidatus Scalindua sp. AMX11]GJQ60461.1 MAG: hypothetical protein SCALA701_32620 [Candidatus Scalindua sp.]
MTDSNTEESMKASIIKEFIERITRGKQEHTYRFFELFSARGFQLDYDAVSGKVRLSNDSHIEDGDFLKILQNINYKKLCTKSHEDSIDKDIGKPSREGSRHTLFDTIDTQQFDIDNKEYVSELFMNQIPVDQFRLNWERDWFGKFEQFKKVEHLPKVRVYDLEPFIARLVKAVSAIGISSWSSCEGHWGEPAFINFDRKYHRIWFQTLLNQFISKKLHLVCKWDWWENRCTISSPSKDLLELYLEIQEVARLIYKSRDFLRNIKKECCALMTDKQKSMNKKDLLCTFEGLFENCRTLLNTNI